VLEGRPTVFLSCSEAYKLTVGRSVASELASTGIYGVVLSDAPLLIGDDGSPDGKVERYLDVADAFVALCTPDDRLRSGQVHCRQNIIDEIQRARQKPHLRNRIILFKDALVTLPSNLGLTYVRFDASRASGLGGVVRRQLLAWQVVGAETDISQGANARKSDVATTTSGRVASMGLRGLLSTLADPIAREIVTHLLDEPQTQKALGAALGVAASTITRRVRTLEDTGLVARDSVRGPCYLTFPDATRRVLLASAELAASSALHHAELVEADARTLRSAMLRPVPDASSSRVASDADAR